MIMLLKNNSRMSNSELAEELKVSRITARKVMETLIKDGSILDGKSEIDESMFPDILFMA